MICSSCGEENPERFRICGFCGAVFPSGEVVEARKIVTLVFADVTGSTALGERLDPESVRWVMSEFFEIAREVLEGHGGTVEKFIGDAVMAAFGIPRVREDDALRGVRAAGALRDRLLQFGLEVEGRYGTGVGVRIGVNTGEVVAGDTLAGQAFASGDAVNVAARLEQAAASGEVLLGEETLQLVRDAVTVERVEPLALRGKARAVAVWRLGEVALGAPGVTRKLDAPLVGRSCELAQLLECWQRAVSTQDMRVVTLVAAAGTGKTRLMSELAASIQPDAQVAIGHCLPYGEGITFFPIAEAIRAAASVHDDDSPDVARSKVAVLLEGEESSAEILGRLAPALGLPHPMVALEETFWAIRKLFEALARRRPLLIVMEDVHWAEETLLDLVEYLAAWIRGVPLLFICLARPDLLERRPSIAGPRANARTMLLEPLGSQAAEELMAWQLGGASLSTELAERILVTSAGNPLFVQELLRMLIDDGTIERCGATWQTTTDVRTITMPPTVQALLAARLDQLESEERDIAQRASVVGYVFPWSGLRELCSESARDGLSHRLHTLVRKGIIVPEVSSRTSEDAFRFGHILVREAAYAGLTKRTRAELHERFADWLETSSSGRLTELDEVLGYHLEHASAYRSELGDTVSAQRVGARASTHLARAGRDALAAGDLATAANLLSRAADILSADALQRCTIRLHSVPAFVETGRFAQAGAAIDEVLAHVGEGRLYLAACAWRGYLDDQRGIRTVGRWDVAARTWLRACEQAGDHAGQGTALGFLAQMQFWDGHAAAADAIWQRAAEHAALAGDAHEEAETLVYLLISALTGPTPVGAALNRCAAIADRPAASRKVRAMASIQRGVLEALQGHIERGRDCVARGREQLEELGLALLTEATAQEVAVVERLAGDASAAEAVLRRAFDRLEGMGATDWQIGTAAMLSRALYAQGRFDEAGRFADLCPIEVGEDVTGIGCSTRALIAARRGDDETALRLAEEAVTRMSASDWLWAQADRFVVLADVHALGHRQRAALAALARADALYGRKGCLAALKRTAQRRAALRGDAR